MPISVTIFYKIYHCHSSSYWFSIVFMENPKQILFIEKKGQFLFLISFKYLKKKNVDMWVKKQNRLFFLKLTFPKSFLHICMLHKAKLKWSNESIVVHFNNYQLSKAKLIIMARKSNTYVKVLKKSSLIEIICCHLNSTFKIMIVTMTKSSSAVIYLLTIKYIKNHIQQCKNY